MGATKDSNYVFGTLLLHNKSTASSARKRLGRLRRRINDLHLLLLLLLLYFFAAGRDIVIQCVHGHFGSPVLLISLTKLKALLAKSSF